MKLIFKLALQGLAAVLPVALTLYLVYWLLLQMETVAGAVIQRLIPDAWYFEGLGVISGFAFLVIIGILVNAYVVRYLIRMGDNLLSRIPLIKSLHGAIQDVMQVFSIADSKQAESVVLVEVAEGMRLIGFVTGRSTAEKIIPGEGREIVGVYLPMSYQLGGYTLYLEADRLQPLDITVEAAMRIAVTGGIQRD